jgi:hypothetical protein
MSSAWSIEVEYIFTLMFISISFFLTYFSASRVRIPTEANAQHHPSPCHACIVARVVLQGLGPEDSVAAQKRRKHIILGS